MNETLNKISDIITRYESNEWQSCDNLRHLLRELSVNHYHLTKYNVEYGQKYNAAIYNHTREFKTSDAAATRYAELTVPELRHTRKILTATNIVINSMRSEIGILRSEN